MSHPRCGNKDPVDVFKKHIKNRVQKDKGYVLHGSKWTNYKLTYKIVEYSPKLDNNETLKEIKQVFKVWSDVTPLRFIHVTDLRRKVHFDISFAKWMHCCHKGSTPDNSKFDRNGGVLAHAAFPENGGDIHFDDDDDFVLGTSVPASSMT